MKTLDEVIFEAPYSPTDWAKEALHYLREYKIKRERIMAKAQDCEDTEKRLQDEITRYQDAVKEYEEILTDYVALKQYWAEQQANNPLTWDELRTMEGKPVWIWLSPRIKNTPGSGRWEIIYKFNPIGGNKNLFEMEMESRSRFRRKYQGDLWQAYRKERS